MAARNDSQFDLLRAEIADMRAEMRNGFADVRKEVGEVRDELGRRIDDTRRDMLHGAVGLFGSQVAVLAVLLAQA